MTRQTSSHLPSQTAGGICGAKGVVRPLSLWLSLHRSNRIHRLRHRPCPFCGEQEGGSLGSGSAGQVAAKDSSPQTSTAPPVPSTLGLSLKQGCRAAGAGVMPAESLPSPQKGALVERLSLQT